MNDLLSVYLEKARQSQMAMWSAIGNVFGFIVSAASIIAAVKKDFSTPLVFTVLLISFCGVSAVMGCFLVKKKEYLRLIEELANIGEMTPTERIRKAQREIATPSPVIRAHQAKHTLDQCSDLFPQVMRSDATIGGADPMSSEANLACNAAGRT